MFQYEPYVIENNNEGNVSSYTGYCIEILCILSQQMNFR